MTRDPRVVFNQIFNVIGASRDPHARERIEEDRSILDWLLESTRRLDRRLGTADRVRLLDSADSTEIERLLGRVGGLQQKMWRLGLEGSGASPQLMQLVLPSINAVIDLHTTHLYTAHRHLPPAIMAVLLGIAAVGFGLVGFNGGHTGQRFLGLDMLYGAVLATGLWMVIDLDFPRMGVIRLDNAPLIAALQSMG